jgi:hypothetical protein
VELCAELSFERVRWGAGELDLLCAFRECGRVPPDALGRVGRGGCVLLVGHSDEEYREASAAGEEAGVRVQGLLGDIDWVCQKLVETVFESVRIVEALAGSYNADANAHKWMLGWVGPAGRVCTLRVRDAVTGKALHESVCVSGVTAWLEADDSPHESPECGELIFEVECKGRLTGPDALRVFNQRPPALSGACSLCVEGRALRLRWPEFARDVEFGLTVRSLDGEGAGAVDVTSVAQRVGCEAAVSLDELNVLCDYECEATVSSTRHGRCVVRQEFFVT